jgi:hypothetical protein
MNSKRLLYISLMFMNAIAARAESRHAGSSLELGTGARSLALGGYTVALYGRVDDFHANPAAMGMIKHPAIGLMYAPTFGKLNDPMAVYHYVGGVMPLYAGGTIAVHWTRYAVDDIPLYPKLSGSSFADRLANSNLRPSGSTLGSFQDNEDVFYLSFARSFRPLIPLSWLYGDLPITISVGLNIKLLRQKLYSASASALGLDAGAMFQFSLEQLLDMDFLGDLNVAISALDLTQTPVVWSTKHEDRIRRAVLSGFSYREDFGRKDLSVQCFYTLYQKYRTAHLYGMEAQYRGIALRLGQGDQGLHFGAGLSWRNLEADYAFTSYDLGVAHRLSCSYSFIRKKSP